MGTGAVHGRHLPLVKVAIWATQHRAPIVPPACQKLCPGQRTTLGILGLNFQPGIKFRTKIEIDRIVVALSTANA